MESRKNLTRFTYDTTAFQGWRLSLSKRGTTFTKYYSDKQYGGQRKALKAANTALAELKELLDGSRLVDGKLSKTTNRQGEEAVGWSVVTTFSPMG